MPVANNLLTSVILAPIVTILSALSLSTLQRLLDYINTIASTPQKGFLRQIKPYAKHVDGFLDRLFGEKLTVSTTTILLMAVIIVLLCLLLEGAEKPKSVRVIKETKKD